MNLNPPPAEGKAEEAWSGEPLLVDAKTTRAKLDLKKTQFFQLCRQGVLVRRKAGAKTLVTMASIKAFAAGNAHRPIVESNHS